jgi:hypothetical protein
MSGCSSAISPGGLEAMVSVEETARALHGVYRIAVFDRAGAASFGRDVKSCARSFWAYAIASPALGLLLASDVYNTATDQPVPLAAGYVISEVIQVAGFPLLLLPLLRWFGRSERWLWFVTSYNWYSMAQAIAYVALQGLLLGLPGSGIRGAINIVAKVYLIVIEAFLAATVLEIGPWRASCSISASVSVPIGSPSGSPG